MRGYDVAVLDLPASLAAHPPPDDTLSIALDATQDQQVADAATALREQAPTLKGFVNAPGFLTQRVPTLEIAPDNWAESIEGNLTSAFYSARHFAPLIAPGGAMVVIGSGSGASPPPGLWGLCRCKSRHCGVNTSTGARTRTRYPRQLRGAISRRHRFFNRGYRPLPRFRYPGTGSRRRRRGHSA